MLCQLVWLPNLYLFFRYITYSKEEEAIRCIQNVHGFVLDGRPLRYEYLYIMYLFMYGMFGPDSCLLVSVHLQGLFWNHKILSCMAAKYGMKITISYTFLTHALILLLIEGRS